jgi:hypothetical protein
LHQVLTRRPDGSYLIPAPAALGRLDALDRLHERWSDRLWEAIEDSQGVFESALEMRWRAA